MDAEDPEWYRPSRSVRPSRLPESRDLSAPSAAHAEQTGSRGNPHRSSDRPDRQLLEPGSMGRGQNWQAVPRSVSGAAQNVNPSATSGPTDRPIPPAPCRRRVPRSWRRVLDPSKLCFAHPPMVTGHDPKVREVLSQTIHGALTRRGEFRRFSKSTSLKRPNQCRRRVE